MSGYEENKPVHVEWYFIDAGVIYLIEIQRFAFLTRCDRNNFLTFASINFLLRIIFRTFAAPNIGDIGGRE